MAHLHSVKLRGFKTFARPTELVFEPGVTVIIGPNGSGKSNLADAVLWVLGEQSPGNLRGRTMQDVIFSGPERGRTSAVAEVSLVFDNRCGSLPLDCSQVEVTRRLVREGGSEYRLNGVGCRLLDVQDLVGGLGLGREMHSVISQGKVEALLNSTPEARRALVEEAAGLGRYKKRRERARVKLERTRQNLLRISDVEREVKNSLRPLRQQVVAAERFAQASEEWALARAKQVLLELLEAGKACADTEGVVRDLQARRAEIERRLAALRGQRATEETLFTAALREREDLAAGYHRARSEAERLEARAVSLRQRVARAEGELDRARRRQDLAGSELAVIGGRLKELSAATTDEIRLRTVAAAAHSLRVTLDETLPAYRAALAEEDELKDTVFEGEAARTRAHHDRDFLRREADEKTRGQKLTALLGRSRPAADLGSRRSGSRAQGSSSEEAVGVAGSRLELALGEREDARARSEQAARDELHYAELLTGMQSREGVLQDLLERREGTPAGARELIATTGGARLLTEALTVAPGYERAFTAALGPLAQAVVLPGAPDVAQVLGTGGVLEAVWQAPADEPASSTKPNRESGTGAAPAGTRDLWELVAGPGPVIAVLRSLVPPTAVVDDAVSLATVAGKEEAREWCLVTRSGELARSGLHVARRSEAGAEAMLRARNELEAVGAEREALGERRSRAALEGESAAGALREAETAFREAEDGVRVAERRAMSAKNEADLHARRIEEARVQRAELEGRLQIEGDLAGQTGTELAQMETVIAGHERDLEAARSSLRSLQTRLDSLRREVTRLEGKKGQAALLEVRLRERCRAQEGERERAERQKAAAALEADRCGRRVSLLSRYLPALQSLLEVVDPLAGRAVAAVKEMDSRVEEARNRSEEAAKTIRDWGGAEAELERELEGIHSRLTESQIDQARLEDRRSSLEEELSALRQRHMSPRALGPVDLVGETREALAAAAERAERRRERIGPVNPLAEQECKELEERARFLGEQRRDLETSLAQLQDVIQELDEHIESTFSQIFAATSENFSGVIATVFPGAKGILRLSEAKGTTLGDKGQVGLGQADGLLAEAGDDGDIGEDGQGILLEVKLPNKAPRSMSLLSGGEKAMTAIAFLFSLFLARPCPFYLLDEVEASLDDVNIRRFLALIRKYRDKTQFIIITHQRQTMEVADTLYGVALESDGTSRVLSRRMHAKKEDRRRDETPAAADLVAKEA